MKTKKRFDIFEEVTHGSVFTALQCSFTLYAVLTCDWARAYSELQLRDFLIVVGFFLLLAWSAGLFGRLIDDLVDITHGRLPSSMK